MDEESLAEEIPISDALQRVFPGPVSPRGEPSIAKRQVYAMIRAAREFSPAARAFIEFADSLTAEARRRLPLEALCIKAEVSSMELLGAIVKATYEFKKQESALLTIMAHPEVVRSTIESAAVLGPAGVEDRKMIHNAVGYLPTNKGTQIINIVGKPPGEMVEGAEPDDDAAWDETFPSLSAKLEQLGERRRRLAEKN